ncbi:bifunctional 4-hydroxy-2-oxoglutarate aldolase/2-dehydro-3-deoxy-phosphogluconate aldolase [Kitasatospora viridis]|uniref:2-dehydro-3-deoxyphosphogluconate aldolase/(4S)-4-hydroxy-2-oxoglutarate aldolase n=1 Tax=Kitasatospora viridis TaxID=281105 RepID=A0A561SF60_9ACTN|nr:bifunctional 4-hydroxy-2-oxoglutarate aldolase/2-dehydro-3-deoxy-phosphogluconate aldolase [Kitasatospora viridis]TWF73501.1 2-dehydro-3-deoxyphosphogluconate aldolase/(4S)-4-hydroxy-2-oxoglutarate aldolase [Kitasatospora viridis]
MTNTTGTTDPTDPTDPTDFRARLAADRVIAVVRAPHIPDAAALCEALLAGGVRWIELTCTTPDVMVQLERAAAAAVGLGCQVGLGTVLTAEQARQGIAAGAGFLVTPGLRPEVAEVAARAGVPVVLGAMTPTEVAGAVDLGAAAVKVFPAGTLGPDYFADLRGPFPEVPLVASGGVGLTNAAAFLAKGALAVCGGGSLVPPGAVAEGVWSVLTSRARKFTAALDGQG